MDKEAAEMFFKVFSSNKALANMNMGGLFFAFGTEKVIDGLIHYFYRDENIKKFSCSPIIFYLSNDFIKTSISIFSDVSSFDEVKAISDSNTILDKFRVLFDINEKNIIPVESDLDDIIKKISELSFTGGAFFVTPDIQDESMQFFLELYKILSVEVVKVYSEKMEKK